MKFLLYSINYAPEEIGIGKYNAEMCDWLVSRGHDVRVVTAYPYYPHWKVAPGFSNRVFSRQTIGRVDVWRCPLWVPSRVTGIRRLVHLLSYACSSGLGLFRHLFWRPDVVFVVEPTFFSVPAALLFATLAGSKAWLHIQDFEIDAAFDLGIIPKKWGAIVKPIERVLNSGFHGVSTISQRMLQRAKSKGVAPERLHLFRNWVDPNHVWPCSRVTALRRELGIGDDTVVALYSGNLGEKQGIELVIDAARKLKGDAIAFIICGSGANADRLKEYGKGVANISWLPLQPTHRLNELLNTADIHLLPQKKSASDLVLPSKLTGMLASGRPIVATVEAESEIAEILQSCGISVIPESVDPLVEAIRKLAGDPDLRQRLGAHARIFAEKSLAIDSVLSNFETLLRTRTLSHAEAACRSFEH